MKIHKLPSGSYNVRIMIDGKSISITRDTEQAVREAAEDLQKGKDLAPASMTVRDAVEAYINEREAVLSPSTVTGYRAMLRVRFPQMMPKKAVSITQRQWQTAISDEAKMVGPKTVKNAWGLVSSALAYNGIDVPQVHMPMTEQHEHEFLEPDQIPAFMSAIRGKRVEIPALLALHGMRKSEFLALTWDKIDLDKRRIHITDSLVKNSDREYVLKHTNKNHSSSRVIPIMIQRLYDLLAEADKSKPVVTYRPSSIFTAVNNACDEAGLPRVGVHGLRHSAVSLAYSLGLNEMACMRLFGYSDYNTMRKIYTHLAEKDMERGLDNMISFFNTSDLT